MQVAAVSSRADAGSSGSVLLPSLQCELHMGFEERDLCHLKVVLLLLVHLSSALPILQSLLTDKPRAVLLSKATPGKG